MSANPQSLAYPTRFGPPPPYVEPRRPRFVPSYLGPLSVVTPPSGLAVTLAQAKQQCNIDGADSDDYLQGILIPSASALAEAEIQGERQFLTATYDLPLAGWWGCPLRLPRPPLQSVAWVKYFDPRGVQQTLPPSLYVVQAPWKAPGTVAWAPGVAVPAVQYDRDLPVTVRFACGYGAAADLPAEARHAILMILAHANRYRGDDDEAGKTSALDIPPAAKNLLRKLDWGSYS